MVGEAGCWGSVAAASAASMTYALRRDSVWCCGVGTAPLCRRPRRTLVADDKPV